MDSRDWLTRLAEHGQRITPARRAVVEAVAGSERASTPVQVYDAARRQHPQLGLVSVYRTLETLEQLGLVQRLHQPEGCEAFIAAGEGHRHLLVCQRCGLIKHFEGDDLEPLIETISQTSGYQIRQHWLQLFGLCPDCQRKLKGEE